MTKISQKTREQAALICAVAASTPVERYPPYYSTVVDWLGLESYCDAEILANAALEEVRFEKVWCRGLDSFPAIVPRTCDEDAEAEALLRTGWCPGE